MSDASHQKTRNDDPGFAATRLDIRRRCHLLVLAALVALALAVRLHGLWPPERGLSFAADADEGIYATSARLALDGYLPYRDYFCSAPPLALYLFIAVLAPTSPHWGSESGFMALRYVSVAYGLATLLATYGVAALLGGRAAGLLAAGLLAIDGWVVAQDRRAMLEAPMNLFSTLAVLALVMASLRAGRQRWYVIAGVMAGLAILSKTQGLVVLAVLLVTLALQRRWRPAAVVLSAAVATYGLLSLPFLLRTADDLVRQLFVFQFLRPPNGDPAIMLRIRAIRNYPESWLTVRLGLMGGGLLALRWLGQVAGRLGRREGQWPVAVWLPVLVWAVLVAASFAVSKTFYLYYYVQLAVPLALLGGSLLHPWAGIQDVRGRQRLRASAAKTLPGLAPLVIAAVLIALAAWRLPVQLRATVHGTQWVKTAHAEAGRYLNQQTAPGARLLVFEPNYAFLASRPPARLADGVFFIDSHAYMLYLNLGITQETWTSLLWRLVRRDMTDEQTVLWQKPAQDAVLGALANAEYVVLDPRARYLLAPDTLRQVQGATVPLASFADTSILRIR